MTLLCILVVTIPVGVQIVHTKQTSSLFQVTPRGADSTIAIGHIQSSFAPGIISPYFILVENPKSNGEFITDEYLNILNTITERLGDSSRCDPSISRKNTLSLATITDHCKDSEAENLSLATCLNRLLAGTIPKAAIYRTAINYVYDITTSKDGRSSIISITTPYDPTTDKGVDFVSQVRDHVLTDDLPSNYNYYFTSEQVTSKDAADSTFDAFPKNIIITFAIVCFVVSVAFQNAFITVRYILTLMIPISFIFGIAVLVYQDNMFGWTGWRNIAASSGPLFWFVPVLTFFVAMGLALDYDIFLYLRIMEFRYEGYSNKMSIEEFVHIPEQKCWQLMKQRIS